MKPVEIEFIMRDKLTEGLDKAGSSADSLGEKAEAASKLITSRIAEQKTVIKQVEKDLKSLEKQYAKMPPGSAQLTMQAEINACKKALDEERAALSGLETEHEKASVSAKRLSMQLREMQNAMAQLRLQGKENTKEYQEMADKAAILSDTIGDLRNQTNVLAHDNAGLQGVMSAVNGVSGAFTAATGVMSLFASENEDLAKIQTRVQSVMAITMGLQQLMNTLNRDSAFRLVTVVKAKNMLTAANARLSVSLGISTAAAKALMATLTLGLSVVITGLIVAWDKYSDSQDKAAEKAKKFIETESQGREIMVKTRAEIAATMRELKNFTGSKEKEKSKIDELNKKYGESFGYYNTIADWYDALIKKSEDYIQMLFLQAKAQSLVNDAVEADKEVNQIKANGKEAYRPYLGDGGKINMMLGGDNVGKYGSDPADIAYNKALKEAEAKRDSFLMQSQSIQDQITAIGDKKGIGGFSAPEKPEGPATQAKGETLADLEIKARQKIEDQVITLMKEGAEKQRATALQQFEREKERIQKEETERLALYDKLKAAGENVTPDQRNNIQEQAATQRLQAAALYDTEITAINQEQRDKEAEHLTKLLEPYRTFAQQRIDIEKQYDRDIDALRQPGSGASADNIRIAEENKNQALAELDMVMAQKDASFQAFLSNLTNMSLEKLYFALDSAEKALKDSEAVNGKDSDKNAVVRAKIATLKDEISYVKAENKEKAPDDQEKWKRNSSAIKACKSEIDNMVSSMDFLDESTKSALQAASNIAGGAVAMIDGIKLLSVGAAESISAVEKASVILAIIGAAVQVITAIFSMASAAEEKHQKALEEVATAKLAMQREYNLLLLQQNLLMKEATTIFGEKEIAKAANAIEVYRQAIDAYKKELKGDAPKMNWKEILNGDTESYKERLRNYNNGILGLSEVSIKTGHKKTGLFGWGKGKDIYSGVLDVYPDLIDAENKLNVARAQAIVNNEKMSDANKALLQDLINLQQQADEALESLRGYLQDTFGSLGDGILESIEDAIINGGKNAWESFGDSGAKVLENLGKQLAYSLFFAEKFKKLQSQLESIYGSGKSEEDIANDAMNLIGDFYNGIGKDMSTAQDWMEKWKEKAAEQGFDLWTDKDASQSGNAGAFTAMSQEQGTKLEGLFTSVQMHTANMDGNVENISNALGSALDLLGEVVKNTAYCRHLEQLQQDIALIKRDGLKMK